jgi:hypothetical protein
MIIMRPPGYEENDYDREMGKGHGDAVNRRLISWH